MKPHQQWGFLALLQQPPAAPVNKYDACFHYTLYIWAGCDANFDSVYMETKLMVILVIQSTHSTTQYQANRPVQSWDKEPQEYVMF